MEYFKNTMSNIFNKLKHIFETESTTHTDNRHVQKQTKPDVVTRYDLLHGRNGAKSNLRSKSKSKGGKHHPISARVV
ncbi:hypothetical protein NCAS_0F03520 [Naumovozyma castellii]|uniref:Uncharacterized protein n=1 Tax=Naumovozyma castellii TaxID=27288 RepID=G0VH63_NAUCA|nr:hypothetical protein NCAS_0F03520 [Naumovozyma castellii CBS 4309]CCC70836.1 hypothetical protein NCAS_0F03520 [Naumovozyma castellii CBS 4309]